LHRDCHLLQKHVTAIANSLQNIELYDLKDTPQKSDSSLIDEGCDKGCDEGRDDGYDDGSSSQGSFDGETFEEFVLPVLPNHTPLRVFQELDIPTSHNGSETTLTNANTSPNYATLTVPTWTKMSSVQPGSPNVSVKRAPRLSWLTFPSVTSLQLHPVEPQAVPQEDSPLPLPLIRARLSPEERQFFLALNKELEKVASFYLIKEAEMKIRNNSIKQQFLALVDHQKLLSMRSAPGPRSWHAKSGLPSVVSSVVTFISGLPRMLTNSNTAHQVPDSMTLPNSFPCSKASNTAEPARKNSRALHQSEYLNIVHELKKEVLEHYRLVVPFSQD
jgi:hypothetical protein